MYIVVSQAGPNALSLSFLDETGTELEPHEIVTLADFPQSVATKKSGRPRWVWHDTASIYSSLLKAKIRVERCFDLRLSRTILRLSSLSSSSVLATAPESIWDRTAQITSPDYTSSSLFEFTEVNDEFDKAATLAEFRLQLDAVRTSRDPNRLQLLLAAESAGALIAAEMSFAGLPWRTDLHNQLLIELLGTRAPSGQRPARLEKLATEIRDALTAPKLNPDSPGELVKELKRAGLAVTSTRSWELKKIEHPVIEPLLNYKKLSRLMTANGWSWMETWVHHDRFHPDYVPGGVVSGRWATRGGGALQLPKQIRRAVTADEGWKLVVADAAQLEPRILAGISGDTTMAHAGAGKDLYEGIVASGAVETRAQAKLAMLGAMYGGTTGESGRLLPRLSRAFPQALRFVEDAARRGERAEIVTSRLGRSSPPPGAEWQKIQARASEPSATEREQQRARQHSRDWGRFTRNFVVQASAADWALCWLAELRRKLAELPLAAISGQAAEPFNRSAHLVFFLHDEIIVHAPASQADTVSEVIHAAAITATRLLFGAFPIEIPLQVTIVDSYADSKSPVADAEQSTEMT